jgi:hypothetical protein
VNNNCTIADAVMSFHLRLHADELLNICVVWKKKVGCIPCAWPVAESWGPLDEALLQATHEQVQPSFREKDDDQSEEESDNDEHLGYDEIGDDELMDAIEGIALTDEYRYDGWGDDSMDDLEDIDNDFMPSSPTKLTSKRRRL